jgi:PqqD family protein of HPr-rel-A system
VTTPTPNPQTETWRIAVEVDWRSWSGEIVVYNGRSGDTHHFADFAGWMFARLAAQPASAAVLASAASDTVELRSGEASQQIVARTLVLFQQLDLLERVA